MSRLDRLAEVERMRRDRAGKALSQARSDLALHQAELARATLPPSAEAGPPSAAAGSGAVMLAERMAAGRMVERLIEATNRQRQVVLEAERHFAKADRRANQMERAAELEAERLAIARQKAEEKAVEDTVIAVSTQRPSPLAMTLSNSIGGNSIGGNSIGGNSTGGGDGRASL